MKHFLSTGVLAALLVSCTVNPEPSKELETIGLTAADMNSTHLNLREAFRSVEYLRMETTDSTKVDDVCQIIARGGFVYLADATTIYKLNGEGKVEARLNRVGRGAEKYASIVNFQLDENDQPWILSTHDQTLYHYDWSGRFLDKVKFGFWARNILYQEGKMWVYAGNERDIDNEHQLVCVDLKTGKEVRRERKIDKNKANYLHIFQSNNFVSSSGQTYFFQACCDTIFTMEKDGSLSPRYVMDFDGKNIPESFYAEPYENIIDFSKKRMKEDFAWNGSTFLKKGNDLALKFIYDGQPRLFVRRGGQSFCGSLLTDEQNLPGYEINLSHDIKVFSQDDSSLIIELDPNWIVYQLERDEKPEAAEQAKQFLHYTKRGQNPVLLRLSL